jgi:hypothetical protein
MLSGTPTDSLQHTPAPVGMYRHGGGWSPMPRVAKQVLLPDEDEKPQPWTPTMTRLMSPEPGYPTIMDLMVLELTAEPGELPSDDP